MPSIMDNYSGFLAAFKWPGRAFGSVILGWIYYLLMPHCTQKERVLAAVLFLASVWIPYREGTIWANLHLCASYASFLWINFCWYRLYQYDLRMRNAYIVILVICGALCLSASSISGPAEFLFMSFMSITLTMQ